MGAKPSYIQKYMCIIQIMVKLNVFVDINLSTLLFNF